MPTTRRIVSENAFRATVLIHGDNGATGVFVDPKEFNNPITNGGATGFLSKYLWEIDSISWTMDSATTVQLRWQSTDNEQLLSMNGTGTLHMRRDYQTTLGARYPGATGFTGVLNGVVSGATSRGWTVTINLKKNGEYFTQDKYGSSL